MTKYENLPEFLAAIPETKYAERIADFIKWVQAEFPNLQLRLAWNQPMFTDHGTFILGLSAAKNHMAIAAEDRAFAKFLPEIEAAGYPHTKQLFQIPWTATIDHDLLKRLIQFNIDDKADVTTFWR